MKRRKVNKSNRSETQTTDLENTYLENADLGNVVCLLIEKFPSFILDGKKENLKELKTIIGTGSSLYI